MTPMNAHLTQKIWSYIAGTCFGVIYAFFSVLYAKILKLLQLNIKVIYIILQHTCLKRQKVQKPVC